MSKSSFIDINLINKFQLNSVSLIGSFINYGWELNDHGKIVYLPLGDDYNFDWTDATFEDKEKVFDELQKKQNFKETIGVVLTYKVDGTLVGGNLLFLFEENQISFSLNINLKKLVNGITDFDWYKDRVFPPLKTIQSQIESIYFCQSNSSGDIEFEKILKGNNLF